MTPVEQSQACLKILHYMKQREASTTSATAGGGTHHAESNHHHVGPNVVSYTLVMDALAQCQTLSATEQAEQLFTELQDRYRATKDDRYRPAVKTYTTLIHAWSKTPVPQAPERATAWLQQALNDYEQCVQAQDKNQQLVQPNARLFTVTMQAWARSKSVQKAARAYQLLQQMKQLVASSKADGVYDSVAPNLLTYKTVLEACSYTPPEATAEQQTAALKIAFAVFHSLQRDPNIMAQGGANHVIYTALLRCVAYLMTPGTDERHAVAKAVFEKAVAAGQVDESVLRALQLAVNVTVYQELLTPLHNEQGVVDLKRRNVPAAWKKNVRR